jgi:hypothetical protein
MINNIGAYIHEHTGMLQGLTSLVCQSLCPLDMKGLKAILCNIPVKKKIVNIREFLVSFVNDFGCLSHNCHVCQSGVQIFVNGYFSNCTFGAV